VSVRLDTLKEKIEWYLEVKRRFEILKNMEKETGLPLPECREYISLALQLIEKIRDESEGKMTAEEIKRSVFKDWLEKKQEA